MAVSKKCLCEEPLTKRSRRNGAVTTIILDILWALGASAFATAGAAILETLCKRGPRGGLAGNRFEGPGGALLPVPFRGDGCVRGVRKGISGNGLS